MTNAVVYARYSSHNQTEQSIEGQLAAAKAYADAKGYTIVQEYCDRAVSGRTDNREAFQRMLADCAKHQFEVIIVWKVDRFGRNRQETAFHKHHCKRHGVRVEYVAETLPDGPEGIILESVLEGLAEYYSVQLSQNVRRGMLESAKKRQVLCGCLPFGYRIGEDRKYELDPKTAPFAREVFEKYLQGESLNEITLWLNDMGLRTPKGNKFGKNYVHRMLTNERYAGVYIFKDIIRDEGGMPAIVDRGTFDMIQTSLKNRKKPAGSYGLNEYMLSGKLYCGKCGAQMVGESGIGRNDTKYTYYTCLKRKKDHACDKKNVSAEWLEKTVLDEIIPFILDDDVIEFIAMKTYEFYLEDRKKFEQDSSVAGQIADVERSIKNLTKAIAAGVLSDEIINQINELEERKTALLAIEAERQLEASFTLTEAQIRVFLKQFKELDYSDRKCQQKLIDVFVNAIYLYDDHIKVIFNYNEGSVSIPLKDLTDVSDASQGAGLMRRYPNRIFLTAQGRIGLIIKIKDCRA